MPAPTILPFGDAVIARAAALIANGQVVAVPTETVYGLAADACSADAVARIYAAKGRPSFNPLIVHVLDAAAARDLALFGSDAEALAAAFWPGPLTLVLPVRGGTLAPAVTAGLATVAIRVPAHRAMRGLLKATGKPLAAPSANRSGGISPTRAEHVAASLGDAVPLIIDDGACPQGLESTIVLGRTILRPGPITTEQIAKALAAATECHPGEGRGPVATNSGERTTSPTGDAETGLRPSPGWGHVTAPGQLASHYAPRKPLRLNVTTAAPDEYLIGFGPIPGDETLSPTGDLHEAAATLFAALHRADASDRARIAVAPIPTDGIGAAIADRLKRAAHRSSPRP